MMSGFVKRVQAKAEKNLNRNSVSENHYAFDFECKFSIVITMKPESFFNILC